MNNMLNPSSLNIIPKPKRTSKLNHRLVSSNIDHGDNLDAESSTDIESDTQPSKSSSNDESVNSIIKSKLFQYKIILFPKQFQPKDHSQSFSISISKINQYSLQTHNRPPCTFPLLFLNINPNIVTLKPITTSDTSHNEDIH